MRTSLKTVRASGSLFNASKNSVWHVTNILPESDSLECKPHYNRYVRRLAGSQYFVLKLPSAFDLIVTNEVGKSGTKKIELEMHFKRSSIVRFFF